jgi:hypothetical protein
MVELNHLRPYYKLASNNVYSGIEAIMFKLAQENAPKKSLLIGPSYLGRADAG